MSRLSSEFERLYLSAAPAGAVAPDQVRAFVFELRRPLDWSVLNRVLRGVQTDLGLPAPAIAVSGGGLELWFSLQEPVAPERARAFLAALAQRWLADVTPREVDFHVHPMTQSEPRMPARQEGVDRWSAFIAPDLAAMFTDAPWLDVEPNDEGQANLLRGLKSVAPGEFDAAERRLTEDAGRAAVPAGSHSSASGPVSESLSEAPMKADPRQFLSTVMNDPSVPLALRIEAAKALLP